MVRYLAVCVGRRPGVYLDDDEGKAQVLHYKGAIFKTFSTEEDAKRYYNDFIGRKEEVELVNQNDEGDKSYSDYNAEKGKKPKPKRVDEPLATNRTRYYCVIAGSYDAEKGIYGYGVMLYNNQGRKIRLQGYGEDRELSALKETAGKVIAAETAIKDAADRGFKKLTVFTDYDGIAAWGIGEWQSDKLGIRKYTDTCMTAAGVMELKFDVTDKIADVEGYVEALELAKEAITEEYIAKSGNGKADKVEIPESREITFVPSLYDGEKYLYINNTTEKLVYVSRMGLKTVDNATLISVNANEAWFEYYDSAAEETARIKLPVSAIRAF